MRIALGSDHGGFVLKEDIKAYLTGEKQDVVDFGTDSEEPVDYPDYALRVAREVAVEACDIGILVCGTGIGMSITANKVPGIRAALCNDIFCAEHARRHNDANVLAIGGRVVEPDDAREIVKTFMTTPFDGGRHRRRIDQITAIEKEWRK